MSVGDDAQVVSIEAALELMGSRELFAEIGGMLLAELPELMGAVRQHAADGNLVELSKMAHRIKGNFGVVAAEEAQAAAKDLEYTARDGDVRGADAALVALEAAVERVVPELERIVAEVAA